MVLRLWVPVSHWLLARNWKAAASGAALTASRVAKRVAVSTPLRVDGVTVVVMVLLLWWVPRRRAGLGVVVLCAVRLTADEFARAGERACGQLGCARIDRPAELLL